MARVGTWHFCTKQVLLLDAKRCILILDCACAWGCSLSFPGFPAPSLPCFRFFGVLAWLFAAVVARRREGKIRRLFKFVWICHCHPVVFEVQFNSAVIEDGLEMQLLTTASILLQPNFRQGETGEPGTQMLFPWTNFSLPARHFSFIKSFPLTITLVMSQSQIKMNTYWENIVSRFWWSQCQRTFIWGVGDIWRLWLLQWHRVSVIFWLHKSINTCLNFILFPRSIKWGTWASLPAGAVLWLNWLYSLNLSRHELCFWLLYCLRSLNTGISFPLPSYFKVSAKNGRGSVALKLCLG